MDSVRGFSPQNVELDVHVGGGEKGDEQEKIKHCT